MILVGWTYKYRTSRHNNACLEFLAVRNMFFLLSTCKKKNWFLFILCRYRYLICWAKKEKVDDDDFQFCAKNWLIRNSIACAKITKLTKNLYNLQLLYSTYMLGKFIELFVPAICMQSEEKRIIRKVRIFFHYFFRFQSVV